MGSTFHLNVDVKRMFMFVNCFATTLGSIWTRRMLGTLNRSGAGRSRAKVKKMQCTSRTYWTPECSLLTSAYLSPKQLSNMKLATIHEASGPHSHSPTTVNVASNYFSIYANGRYIKSHPPRVPLNTEKSIESVR